MSAKNFETTLKKKTNKRQNTNVMNMSSITTCVQAKMDEQLHQLHTRTNTQMIIVEFYFHL